MPVFECSECGWFGSSVLNEKAIECRQCDGKAWRQGSRRWKQAFDKIPYIKPGGYTRIYGRQDDYQPE